MGQAQFCSANSTLESSTRGGMIRTFATRLQANSKLVRHRTLHGSSHPLVGSSSRRSHTNSNAVDDWYIPIQLKTPALQASPTGNPLTDEAMVRLHRLSALEPPDQGSPEFENLKNRLQSMLAVVDSVKDFEPAEDLRVQTNQCEIPDGRIWPADESLPIDWEALVQKQEGFLRSRKQKIPGSRNPNHLTAHPSEISPSKPIANDEYLTLDMAIDGVHTVRRRGLGQQPQNENVFYVAKQPGSARK
ncbi:hypothetical protein PTTG_01588 [Puccinia triticina 1-1 BBBD Race 1]|uniref:Uncharacterized protein n=1 Tax=Puccinia triticina (isolate 1-1 / race 1 (BBBD)) TaxID=630390 RepID=A0A180GNB8_PUCT1|nr:hypothetical protein PTTG_01588 [Puccinia triticina 1-1 BBBD Race 1]WAR55442.1 hypothetical protein PtB15_6B183 [Puccinia triticina]